MKKPVFSANLSAAALAACLLLARGVPANDPPETPAGASLAEAPLLLDDELGERHGELLAPGEEAWWRWTAPEDGKIDIETNYSEFDTVLCVFREAPASGQPERLACNDNRGPFERASFATALVKGGETYDIRLSGAANDHGLYRIAWRFVPMALVAQDTPGKAARVEGPSGRVEAAVPPGGDAWWRWTAPAEGRVSLNTAGTEFGPTISLVKAEDIDPDGYPSAYVDTNRGAVYVEDDTTVGGLVRGGRDYFFYLRRSNIDGFENQRGAVSWSFEPAKVQGLPMPKAAARIENPEAALEAAKPAPEAWWKWTASEDGTLLADASFDGDEASLFAAPDSPKGTLKLLDRGLQVRAEVQTGQGVYLRLASSDKSPKALRAGWAFSPAKGLPRAFETAAAIRGAEGWHGESRAFPGRPAWWRWTAPRDMRVRFQVEAGGGSGSPFAASLRDASGRTLELKTADSFGSFDFDLGARKGEAFFIRADTLGLSEDGNSMDLGWEPAPAE